jgi:inositol 3-alpha-galactosyltransferase
MSTLSISSESLTTLRKEGCNIRQVDSYHPDGIEKGHYVRELYAECWNKLRLWEWTEFDRLVYLDADMVALKNLDHLFHLPMEVPLYAVGDCFGGRSDEEERNACCHFHPQKAPEYFNAGFLVLTPDKEELKRMESELVKMNGQQWRFAEQDFLNVYFAGRWIGLPVIYNAQKRIKYHHPDLWHLEDIAVLHYVDEKPWSHRDSGENQKYRQEIELWWKILEGGNKMKDGPQVAVAATETLKLCKKMPQLQMAAAAQAFTAHEA